jgi:hypothetical protein
VRIRSIIFIVLVSLSGCPAFGQNEMSTVVFATPEQIIAGFAVIVDGVPGYVRADGAVDLSRSFQVSIPGAPTPLTVVAAPRKGDGDQTVVLPILIEDKSLAHGVTIKLITPEGNSAELKIPPKRVFLSIPFNIPVTEAVHPDFGRGNRHLILQIVPKITKKAQVDADNTSTDGLVVDIKYEGLAYLKLKDTLNRTDRRDVDGTFFIGKDEDTRWHLITENLLEKFDERNIAVLKNQRLGGELRSQWRLDRLNNMHRSKFGSNFLYDSDKTSVMFGNIDRKVGDHVHSEIGYGTDRFRALTRFEGIEVVNPSTKLPAAVKVDKSGYQFQLNGGNDNNYYSAQVGNLKVQDFDDLGEIDDYFNAKVSVSRRFGNDTRAWNRRAVSVSGESNAIVWTRGHDSWLEGGFSLDVGYKQKYLTYLRYNNDFFTITGRPDNALWESLFISFMRNSDYFDRKDRLAAWGLDSVYVDFDYSRKGAGEHYSRRIRFGISKFMKVWRYDLPLELFVETVKAHVFRPGITISIRRYL